MKKRNALLATLVFAAVAASAQAGTTSVRALNPQPLPPGRILGSRVLVNPQPLPPGAQGGSALIEGFAVVTEHNIDRINAIGPHTDQGAARGFMTSSPPARRATTK